MDSYNINHKNFDSDSVEIEILDLESVTDHDVNLTASDEPTQAPAVLQSLNSDDDVTTAIKSKQLLIGFNSDEYDKGGVDTVINVKTFADGTDGRFKVSMFKINESLDPTNPFTGNISVDNITEPYQPRPNPVLLTATDGLNSLSKIEIKDIDDEFVLGHYRLIDYLYFCLRKATPSDSDVIMYIAMNLCEKAGFRKLSANFNETSTSAFRIAWEHRGFLEVGDTIEITGATNPANNGTFPVTGIIENAGISLDIFVSGSTFVFETKEVYIFRTSYHAFNGVYVDATTFEKEANSREDMLTVLTKILEAFGCFIVFEEGIWFIIRWDEYDKSGGGVTEMRFALFNGANLSAYDTFNLKRVIAHDGDPLHEGLYLSMDSAKMRFQRKAKEVRHIFKYNLPKELPCNNLFTRVGAFIAPLSGVDYSAYELSCWSFYRGIPQVANDGRAYTKIFYQLGYEKERYTVFSAQPSNDVYYIVSQPFYVAAGDKVDITALMKWSANIDTGLVEAPVMGLRLSASDGTFYYCDAGVPNAPKGEWVLSTSSASYGAGFTYASPSTKDDTDWNRMGFFDRISDMIPKDGKIEVIIMQGWDVTTTELHVKDITVTYYPNTGGSFSLISAQQVKVSDSQEDRLTIEKEMFLTDVSRPSLKGCLKKYNGIDFVVTETWRDYISPEVMPDERLAKFIVFQWWNQYRKRRMVIESDIQGLKHQIGVTPEYLNLNPSQVHTWKINHDEETEKKFMLASFRNMNFRTCGWEGVFVETSDADGDKDYTSDYEFKYIQGNK